MSEYNIAAGAGGAAGGGGGYGVAAGYGQSQSGYGQSQYATNYGSPQEMYPSGYMGSQPSFAQQNYAATTEASYGGVVPYPPDYARADPPTYASPAPGPGPAAGQNVNGGYTLPSKLMRENSGYAVQSSGQRDRVRLDEPY